MFGSMDFLYPTFAASALRKGPTPSTFAPTANPVLAQAQALWQAAEAAPAASEHTANTMQEVEAAVTPKIRPCPIAVAVAACSATSLAAACTPNPLIAEKTIIDQSACWNKLMVYFGDPLLETNIASYYRALLYTPAQIARQIFATLPALDGLKMKLAEACALGAPGPTLTADDETRLANAWELLLIALKDVCARDSEFYSDSELSQAALCLYGALAAALGYALPHMSDAHLRASLLAELEEQELTSEEMDRGVLQWLGHEIELSSLAFYRRDEVSGAAVAAFFAPPLLLFDPDCCDELAEMYETHLDLLRKDSSIRRGVSSVDEDLGGAARGQGRKLKLLRSYLTRNPRFQHYGADLENMNRILDVTALLEYAPSCIDASPEEAFVWRALAKTVRRMTPLVERNYASVSRIFLMDHLVVGAPEGYLADIHRRFRAECEDCVALGEALRRPDALKAYHEFTAASDAVRKLSIELREVVEFTAAARAGDLNSSPPALPAGLAINVDLDLILDLSIKCTRAWHYEAELEQIEKAEAAAAARGQADIGARVPHRAENLWDDVKRTGELLMGIVPAVLMFQCTMAERKRFYDASELLERELGDHSEDLDDAMYMDMLFDFPVAYEPAVPERLEAPVRKRLPHRRQQEG